MDPYSDPEDGLQPEDDDEVETGADDAAPAAAGAHDVTASDVGAQIEKLSRRHFASGNSLAAAGNWDEAVKQYAMALRFARGDRAAAAEACVARSAALTSWCTQLRSRPAALSERRAVYAPDPTHLAELALKDAERAAELRPTWGKAYARQGFALFCLERYGDAETAYLEGLALDPECAACADGLARARAALAAPSPAPSRAPSPAPPGAAAAAAAPDAQQQQQQQQQQQEQAKRQRRRRVVARDQLDDAECVLCMKLLCEPATLACGHSFCRSCLARALDHNTRCPCCRAVVHVARDSLRVTVALKNLLQRSFPEEYAQRLEEERSAAGAAGDGTAAGDGAAAGSGAGAGGGNGAAATVALPLFVMSTLLPGEKMALNIFEPRYRLMVRRVMEGSRRMGMAQVTAGGGLDPVCCEADVSECQQLPDGRYYIELVGRRRVRIARSWEVDGYRVGAAEPLLDVTPAPGSPEASELEAAALAAERLADGLVGRLRALYAGRRLPQLVHVLERIGDKPPARDAAALSWYVGRVALLAAPDAETALRGDLLRSDSALRRLTDATRVLQGRMDGAGGACAVM